MSSGSPYIVLHTSMDKETISKALRKHHIIRKDKGDTIIAKQVNIYWVPENIFFVPLPKMQNN